MKTTDSKKFMSLKVKWSIGTGIGVVFIFAIMFFLLFQSFSTLLLQQEKNYASNALNTAVARLETMSTNLTKGNVKKTLSYDPNLKNKAPKIYDDTVFATLSRKYIGISVYDAKGKFIYASRDVPVRFTKKLANNDTLTKEKGQHIFATSKKIYSTKMHKVIGYVQVTNRLHDYDQTRKKLLLIFIVFGITAGFSAALLSYALSAWFLRPIDVLVKLSIRLAMIKKGMP